MTIEVRDLAKLIKICKASGVSELKIGDTEIKFGGSEDPQLYQTRDTVRVPTAKQLRETEELINIKENVDFVDDQLALMQIENPAQLEELLIQRELESVKTET